LQRRSINDMIQCSYPELWNIAAFQAGFTWSLKSHRALLLNLESLLKRCICPDWNDLVMGDLNITLWVLCNHSEVVLFPKHSQVTKHLPVFQIFKPHETGDHVQASPVGWSRWCCVIFILYEADAKLHAAGINQDKS
jgi:hypothetical protein